MLPHTIYIQWVNKREKKIAHTYLEHELQQLIETDLPIHILDRALGRSTLVTNIVARRHEHIKLNTHAERVNTTTALLYELLHLGRDD